MKFIRKNKKLSRENTSFMYHFEMALVTGAFWILCFVMLIALVELVAVASLPTSIILRLGESLLLVIFEIALSSELIIMLDKSMKHFKEFHRLLMDSKQLKKDASTN